MILQALAQLYDRRSRDPDPARRLPAPGLEDKPIPFVVELRADGVPVQLRDTRQSDGKKLRAQSFLVPQGVKKTSGVAANLLWDSAEYALGVSAEGPSPRLSQQVSAFRQRVEDLAPHAADDIGLSALLAFLAAPRLEALQRAPQWAEMLESNANVSFELQGDQGQLICQRPAVQAAIRMRAAQAVAGESAFCLVGGTLQPVARLHPAIKGVWGAQTSGANIVSFNVDASESYGKEQGLNAPVGEAAVFAYTTALNALLDRGSRNRMQVGDASTVFWAEAPHVFDSQDADGFTLADLFAETDNPDKARDAVRALYSAVRSGSLPQEQADTRFYVLGLSPNAARISVRFWLPRVPFSELASRLLQHFDDIRVARRFDSDPETPSLFRLLTSVALQRKADHIPPRLAGEWMRAILEGLPLPAGLLSAAVQRCRAEREVDYLRASVLKAWLNRQSRVNPSAFPTFMEALDMDNPAPAYRLGRLFATLERIQERAQPGINATIRDRYYGGASTTPVAVFTTLLRLKNAHLRKLGDGVSAHFEKLIGEILGPLDPAVGFPRQLNLAQQGQFALGYYHQRHAFFSSKADTATPDQPQGD